MVDLKIRAMAARCWAAYKPRISYSNDPIYFVSGFSINFLKATNTVTLETFNTCVSIMQGGSQLIPTAIAFNDDSCYVTCAIPAMNDDPPYGGLTVISYDSGLTFGDDTPVPPFNISMEFVAPGPL